MGFTRAPCEKCGKNMLVGNEQEGYDERGAPKYSTALRSTPHICSRKGCKNG